MKKQFFSLSLILILAVGFSWCQDSDFLTRLKEIPGVEVVGETRHGSQFQEAYEIRFTQPYDHKNPDGAKFTHRMFIGHVSFDAPMVMSTSGYTAGGLGFAEPAALLKANLMRIEHRYFGESVPDPLVWKHLTTWNAASDLHEIYEAFKPLYPNKWVSTGHSKDGQTAMMYKAYYPDDIDVAIPYVAPLNKSKTDPRIYEFLDNVGTAEERQKVFDYQIAMFERKDEMMPMVKVWAEKANWDFFMGIDRAYDLAVLEFPFAMWQYGRPKPMDLPGADATPEELMKPLQATNALFYFSIPGTEGFLAHYYQAMNEMGYYGYKIEPYKKYLDDTTDITWDFTLTPYGLDTTFSANTLPFLHDFVHNHGDQILYIYGELDTWTATGVTEIKGDADALVMILKGGYHGSRITAFPEDEQEKIYTTLTRWLGFEVPVE